MLIQWRMEFGLACRRLARTKVFTGVAVITLALGFSGVTIMFALMQGVLLRPLPVHEQHRVVVAWKELPSSGFTHYPFGDVEIEEVAAESRLFDHVAGVSRNGVGRRVVTVDGASIYVRDALVTGGFFDVLGVTPVLGRTIVPEDDREGAEPVVMISHGFWQRRYGSVLDVIGRRVTLAAKPLTIVGVLPPGFDYPVGAEMWRTTRSVPSAFADAARREVDLVGRLVPDATIEQATAELTGLTRRLEAIAPPGVPRGLNAVVRGLHEVMVGDIRPAMLALFAAVSLVLVIASANVGELVAAPRRNPTLGAGGPPGARRKPHRYGPAVFSRKPRAGAGRKRRWVARGPLELARSLGACPRPTTPRRVGGDRRHRRIFCCGHDARDDRSGRPRAGARSGWKRDVRVAGRRARSHW